MIAGAYKHPDCRIGIIIGTGTNAAYVENLDIVDLYEGERTFNREVAINTEWGAFGNTGSLDIVRTIYDYELDRNSLNPGKQVRYLKQYLKFTNMSIYSPKFSIP